MLGVTEVPEHLLQRARERRAILAGETPPAAGGTAVEAAATGAEGGGEVDAASAAPARVAAPVFTGPPPARPKKQRVPWWAMPAVVGLPFWAVLYAGAFGEPPAAPAQGPVAEGASVYRSAGCGACHGPAGLGGGVGPSMKGVNETFPAFADHVTWVKEGSFALKGQTYGATAKPAGGAMPGFATSLTEAEIIAVVCHERVTIGGAEAPPECAASAGEGESASG